MLKWYQCYVIGRFCDLFCLLHCRNWKSMALMSVCNCVISVKKCFLSPNNGFLRFCQGKTQVPIKNYILNSTNRITTVLCQKCLAQQAHIIRASTLHPSSTILLLSILHFLVWKAQKNEKKKKKRREKKKEGVYYRCFESRNPKPKTQPYILNLKLPFTLYHIYIYINI